MSAQYHNISIKTDVKSFFDSITNTISYVVSNPATTTGSTAKFLGTACSVGGMITHMAFEQHCSIQLNTLPLQPSLFLHCCVHSGHDKPILPVHDSYIVKNTDRRFLKLVMNDACNDVLNHTLPFESEFDEVTVDIGHATHYKHTEYGYFESVLSKHKTKVSKLYQKRYTQWLEES